MSSFLLTGVDDKHPGRLSPTGDFMNTIDLRVFPPMVGYIALCENSRKFLERDRDLRNIEI